MNAIIEYINTQIGDCMEITPYGICHLIEDDQSEKYPTELLPESEKITPLVGETVIYHRLLNGAFDPREDLSFGKKPTYQNVQDIRTVVMWPIELDQSYIDDIINAIPDDFEVTGYMLVNVSKNLTLIRDSEAVWVQEYGESYKDKFEKQFNISALEYSVQYIKCPECEIEEGWVLETGIWDDSRFWDDQAIWRDNP